MEQKPYLCERQTGGRHVHRQCIAKKATQYRVPIYTLYNMNTEPMGVNDALSLGKPKFALLGVQHLFAMFGATVLVPIITGLSVSATLLFAGIGTLIFHLVSKCKVPAFLGSSFAFIGGYMSVKGLGMAQGLSEQMALNYACVGVGAAALLYFIILLSAKP